MSPKTKNAPAPNLSYPGKDEIRYVPIGGAGQIGMNLYLYGHAGQWLMVDCGMSFAPDSIPGVDILIPDIGFIMDNLDKLCGIVITHGHEDHIGALTYLWPELKAPIYATAFTAALIREKFSEEGINYKKKLNVVPQDSKFTVGNFNLEFVSMTHSIPESNALLIETPLGRMLHSGDWKLDPTPLVGKTTNRDRLQQLGSEGILAFTCDSTNVFYPGRSGSEALARENLARVVAEKTGKVAVTCFASNVARMESVALAAEKADRHIILAGRSLDRIYKIAVETGHLKPFPNLIDEEQAGYFPDNKILYLCTGCQGEPRSALSKIADQTHPFIKLGEGDTVIFSSREIPGNEISIARLENSLARQGVDIVTADAEKVHVSGHPYREELVEMYSWVRPKIAIPMHGEARHLRAHAALAKSCQVGIAEIVENGQMVSITKNNVETIGFVETGQLALDGTQFIPIDGGVIREKHKFNWNGAIMLSLVLSKNGQLADEPQVSLFSLFENNVQEEVMLEVADAVAGTVEKLSKSERRDDELIIERVKRAARGVVMPLCGKKPIVNVHLMRV